MNWANPSLSQMSRQPSTETESPNHWWASSWATSPGFGRGGEGVRRPGLVLQREADRQAGDQAAGGAERVRPEHRSSQRGDHVAGAGRQVHAEPRRADALHRRDLLGDRRVVGDAVAAGRCGPRTSRPRRRPGSVAIGSTARQCHVVAVAVLLLADEHAVADHVLAPRHGHADVERRLVARVVVGREPPRRHVRLVHRDHLGVVGQPAALAEVALVGRAPGVPDDDAEARPPRSRLLRRDHAARGRRPL